MGRRYSASRSHRFDAPREIVWAIVADTNRWDRAAGLALPTYRWARDEGRLVRQASATELGVVALEWLEPPYAWMEGEFVEGARRFTKGPPSTGGFRVTLHDDAGGVRVEAEAWVEGPAWVGVIQRTKFRGALSRYFASIAAVLASSAADAGDDADAPAVVRARRRLATGYDEVVSGPRATTDEATLARRLRALEAAPVDAALARRLGAWLRERPDEDVAQMRPFELASTWGADRRALLRVFLHATRAGLTDLVWQVNCPVCRVAARLDADLGALDRRAHCGACDIDYELDFAAHVEAVFPVNPAVRAAHPAIYCASSPAFLPHVFGQLRLAPGEVRRAEAALPTGELLVRTLWARHRGVVEVPTARPAELRVEVREEGLSIALAGTAPGPRTALVVTNTTDREAVVLVERAAWGADGVRGTVIASMPEFTDLFATEAPAAGVELRVGHLAVLFSDLTGSTALYAREGDARAFALVEAHFRRMREVVEASGGAVVKTMGDAVMASFPSTLEAVDAALGMIAAHDEAFAGRGIGVKVGVHGGPCLAVRANDRLDYFGGTVNVAARLQAQARPSEVVLLASVAAEEAVAARLGHRARREFLAELKGIDGAQTLVGVREGRPDEG